MSITTARAAMTPPVPARSSTERRGILFIVSAPSGTGKTTLCKQLTANIPGLWHSISYTTRAPRPGETRGCGAGNDAVLEGTISTSARLTRAGFRGLREPRERAAADPGVRPALASGWPTGSVYAAAVIDGCRHASDWERIRALIPPRKRLVVSIRDRGVAAHHPRSSSRPGP